MLAMRGGHGARGGVGLVEDDHDLAGHARPQVERAGRAAVARELVRGVEEADRVEHRPAARREQPEAHPHATAAAARVRPAARDRGAGSRLGGQERDLGGSGVGADHDVGRGRRRRAGAGHRHDRSRDVAAAGAEESDDADESPESHPTLLPLSYASAGARAPRRGPSERQAGISQPARYSSLRYASASGAFVAFMPAASHLRSRPVRRATLPSRMSSVSRAP